MFKNTDDKNRLIKDSGYLIFKWPNKYFSRIVTRSVRYSKCCTICHLQDLWPFALGEFPHCHALSSLLYVAGTKREEKKRKKSTSTCYLVDNVACVHTDGHVLAHRLLCGLTPARQLYITTSERGTSSTENLCERCTKRERERQSTVVQSSVEKTVQAKRQRLFINIYSIYSRHTGDSGGSLMKRQRRIASSIKT